MGIFLIDSRFNLGRALPMVVSSLKPFFQNLHETNKMSTQFILLLEMFLKCYRPLAIAHSECYKVFDVLHVVLLFVFPHFFC